MALQGPFKVVHHEGKRFLCFCQGGSPPRLHVTNTCDLWSCDVATDNLDGQVSQDGTGLPNKSISALRDALDSQTPTLTVRDGKATLQFQDGGQDLTFDLFKVPLSEAREQFQDLTFGLVEQVHQLEKRLKEGGAVSLPLHSPEKNACKSQSLFAPELTPPKGRSGTGQPSAKRRLPGESLINPGFKSKKTPTGVSFDDL